MEYRKLLVLLFVFLMTVPVLSHAASRPDYKNRLEITYSEDYLEPYGSYGSWHSLGIVYRRKHSEDIKFVLQSSLSQRDGFGDGIAAGAGIFKDWTPKFYTYTGISSGSDVDYIPEINIGHSFYFKPGGGHIIPLGFSYIKSRGGNDSYALSSGIVAYRSGGWVYEYNIRRNHSEPGGIISYSHSVGINKGKEGHQWLRLGASFGKWAYMTTALTIPEEIDKNSFSVSLNWRKWLGENYGINTNVSYFNLEDGYDKYGVKFGIFTEF